MKRERVIELFEEAQHEAGDIHAVFRFAQMIEQETLALAANKADSIGHYWSGEAARACFEVAESIREL